jgi:hypothetical protein
MDSQPLFLDCPAHLDDSGASRCALPAHIKRPYFVKSTSGPVEHVVIRCPVGHLFDAPVEFLGLPDRVEVGDDGGSESVPQSTVDAAPS